MLMNAGTAVQVIQLIVDTQQQAWAVTLIHIQHRMHGCLRGLVAHAAMRRMLGSPLLVQLLAAQLALWLAQSRSHIVVP